MHTAWFLAMTKEIVKKIRDSLEDKGKKLVVLIDNAPGYSGLEPAVEEWLTDIGPKYGKFLFVCTLDTQDFIGCSQAIRSIHDAFCGKWKISRYLFPEKKRSTENKSTENKIIFSNKGEKRFFYRLIESIPGKEICGKCSELTPMKTVPPQTCPNDDFCFYRQKENVNVGNGCEKYPAKYMGLLVNKVPILVFNSVYPFDIEVILKENGFEEKKQEAVINFLKQKHWIPYRGEWSYQFMDTDPASKQEKKAGFSHQKLLANLKNSKNTFDRDWQILEKAKAQYSGEFFLKKLVKLQFEYNHVFKDFLNSLNPSQMSDLKSFWSDDFLIISSKKKFFEAIFELFKPSGPIENSSILTQAVIGDISDNIEKSRLSMEAETIAEACWIFKEEIKERIFAFAEHKILPTAAALKKELKTVEMLSVDMAFLKNLNFRKEKIRALIRVLYAMQCIYISNLSDMERLDIEKKLEEVQFWKGLVSTSDRILALAEETLAKVGIHEEIELLAIKDEPKLLATLFKVFIETAMRVMDLNQDFKFLFECIRLILSQQQLATLVNVKLNKLAGAVIVEKTISHKEGRNILFSLGLPDDEISGVPEVEMKEVDPVKFLQTLTKLHDFEDELKKIIGNDQWNMLV
jgi:hypothetical protein